MPLPSTRTRPSLRVFGIDIRIHSSLILLLAYLIFVISLQFPLIARDAGIVPETLALGPLSWAVILAVSLLLSVLLHELGHALTARSLGLNVRSITLMMLGGVSTIDKMPERPISELGLAIAGPVVSFAIWALGYFVARAADSPNWVFFAYWLSRSNLILGIFNLLPAFPLDGGRVLRSVLAIRFGKFRATRISVKVSNVFAIILGILGFLSFNIFLLLVAFFIYAGAQSENLLETTRGSLEGLLAESVATRIPPIQESQTIADAAEQMLRTRQPILPVRTRENSPALILLERILQVPKELWPKTPIREVMDNFTRFIIPSEPLSAALEALATSRGGALPLNENGEPAGVVRFTDLSQAAAFKTLQDSLGSLRTLPPSGTGERAA